MKRRPVMGLVQTLPTSPAVPRSSGEKPTLAQQIDGTLAALGKDAPYDEKATQIEDLSRAINQRITAYAADLIKTEFAARPSKTYSDKLASTRWMNGEMRRFNIAIYSKRLGGLATLSADKGGTGGEGRFKLKAKAAATGQPSNFNTQQVAELLAEIELIDAPRREEGLRKERAKDDPPPA